MIILIKMKICFFLKKNNKIKKNINTSKKIIKKVSKSKDLNKNITIKKIIRSYKYNNSYPNKI